MNNFLLKKNVLKVSKFLDKSSLNCKLIQLNETARSAIEAAKALNKEVGSIVKSLSFKDTDYNFYLCLISGDKYLSEKKLAKITKQKITKANADEVKEQTGFTIGGVSPFSHKIEPKRIFIDKNLNRFNIVYAAAGHPFVVFDIEFNQLVKFSKGEIVDLTI